MTQFEKSFVIDYRDGCCVTPYPSQAEALAALPSEGRAVVAWSTAELGLLSGPELVALYNVVRRAPEEVKRFATKADALRRVGALLAAYDPDLVNRPALAGQTEPEPAAGAAGKKEAEVAKKKSTKVAPHTAKKGPASSSVGKPAGKVSDLKPIREGTARQKVLMAMSVDGGSTVAQAAARAGITEAMVMQHAYCLHRDCGIGYQVVDGKLRALYPGDRTYDDVVKKPAA